MTTHVPTRERPSIVHFPKEARLLSTAQFDRVFARRRSRSDGRMVLYACENSVGRPRLGLVVSRKCGTSVARNRWKRCLREAFRQSQAELPQALDYIVIPRPQFVPATAPLAESLTELAAKLARVLATEGQHP